MVLIYLVIALGTGALGAMSLWPSLGLWSLLVAPWASSGAVALAAIFVAFRRARDHQDLGGWSDELVADLRRVLADAQRGLPVIGHDGRPARDVVPGRRRG